MILLTVELANILKTVKRRVFDYEVFLFWTPKQTDYKLWCKQNKRNMEDKALMKEMSLVHEWI